jgi:hypothetical protein
MVRAGTLGQEEVQHHGHPQFGTSGRLGLDERCAIRALFKASELT